ncbi:hypothetical protein DV515_00005742 [Chloebia gouldiae]|uniref:Uncharacterized protein n=1 Tax=Chloebia gouldiae TaxID=44316 RepID=A0A3L8SM28_CHLGU|nr:hypothetical protein DV515_00005742 [Chloebia gouldiae]
MPTSLLRYRLSLSENISGLRQPPTRPPCALGVPPAPRKAPVPSLPLQHAGARLGLLALLEVPLPSPSTNFGRCRELAGGIAAKRRRGAEDVLWELSQTLHGGP